MAAPMTAVRITPVCASMAPANRHVRRASSSASPAVNWSGVTWSPWSAAFSDGGRDGVGELRVGAGVGQGAGDGVGVESGHASFQSSSPSVDPDRAVFAVRALTAFTER